MAKALILMLLMAASAAAGDPQFAGAPQIIEAARNHDPEALRLLVSRHADVNTRLDDGSTALLWAAHSNDLEYRGNPCRPE